MPMRIERLQTVVDTVWKSLDETGLLARRRDEIRAAAGQPCVKLHMTLMNSRYATVRFAFPKRSLI